MPRNALIQLRRGLAAAWASTNPVLADSEPGYDKTSGTLKVGDGSTAWNSLPALGSGTYVASGPSSADQTVGGRAVQKVTGHKWFQGLAVFGNNTGLAADPRQPFQINNVIDGAALDGSTYGSNKVGAVLCTTFKGSFAAEAGYGVADPAFLFGADDFIITSTTTNDLAGVTDIFGRISELHVRVPGRSFSHLTGFQGQVEIEAGMTVTGGAYAVKAATPHAAAGSVINDLFALYAQQPTVDGAATVTRARAFYTDGIAQFAGATSGSSASGAPSKGAYLGIASTTVGLELSDGPTKNNFRVANDSNGHLNFELAGISVLGQIDTTGGLGMLGRVNAGTGTGTSTPNGQGAAKGAYLGRASSGTVGMELSDGTNNFRIANDSNNGMTFEKAGIAVLGRFDASGNFSCTGGLTTGLVTKTASYTLTASDSVILASGAGVTLTLPTPVGVTGRRYTLKNKDGSNTITVATAAGNVDGTSTVTLAVSSGKTFVSDGSNWVSL